MMSSDEEQRFDDEQETREYPDDNENMSNVEESHKLNDMSQLDPSLDDANNNTNLDPALTNEDRPGKIGEEELPHIGNTVSFKTKFESEPTEKERRTEHRRERRRRRKLTEEEDGPSEGTAKSTASKFEKAELDDMHFQKTDTSHDCMAQSGTVLSTTEKFKSGKYHSESDEENKNEPKVDDLESVESGTAAARRKALEDYAEEAKKSHTHSPNVLEEDAPVLKRGKAANTRAKLEKMSSEERVLEKPVDLNTPKSGTASERRAKFEEKARQAFVEEAPKRTLRTARHSKWPEPNTNYRQRRGEARKSVSADEERGVSVEKEKANNVQKSNDYADGHSGNEEVVKHSSGVDTSSDEAPKSPVKTAEIRNKLVRMLSSEEERTSSPPADLGNARPTSGTARNLRARFETNTQTEESHIHSKKPSVTPRSGYASRVREKFESGEVVSRRRSSVTDEDDSPGSVDTESRRQRASSTRSVEQETSMIPRSAKELRNRFENPGQNAQVVNRNFVLRPKTGTSNITSKFSKTAPASSKCAECTKTVYPMEKITADGKSFHKKCFKCTECKATLRLGNFAALQGKLYCKPHFKQLFKVKGNYDEGFGRQQHKENWKGKNLNSSEDQKTVDHEIDSNANIKVPEDDAPRENGYDHPPDEQTNGYDSLHEDAFVSDDGITT